jgi:predicted nucleic-acid-binding protein
MTTRAIDTNVLIRLLVNDNGEQSRSAASLAARFTLVVLPTVMLETEWVLRSRFKLGREQIVELFRGVIAFEGFIIIDRSLVVRAVEGFSRGMDFADALHVTFSEIADGFATYDPDLVRLAKRYMTEISVELAQ